jgi:ribosome-associated protein
MASDEPGVLRVPGGVAIPERELEWRFTTSGGPGGQHANKTATRAEVRFDAAASPSLTESQRRRITTKLGPVVIVAADDERSQVRNRALALERLRQRLADALHVEKKRRPTKASRASKRRRLDAKTQRGQTKRLRGRVRGDDA